MHEDAFQRVYRHALRAAQVRSATATSIAGLPADEREDLEQEALMWVWRALPRYDPTRACLRTFLERVIASRLSSLLRKRRDRLMVVPLENQYLATNDGIPVLEVRTDVQRVLGCLAERDRLLALRLMEYGPGEAGRNIGMPRSTVYERIRHIRAAFTDAGLDPKRIRRP